jgi:transposase
VRVTVAEHQMIERECRAAGSAPRQVPPAGVTAPVQYGPRFCALAAYLWHGQFLSKERACAAPARRPVGCQPDASLSAEDGMTTVVR